MLQDLANGMITWSCHQPQRHPDQPEQISVPITHPDIQYVADSMVRLPACPHCLAQGIESTTFIKVAFTPEEKAAMEDPKHPNVVRHELFAQHLAMHGVVPPEPEPEPVMATPIAAGDIETILLSLLEKHGLLPPATGATTGATTSVIPPPTREAS